MANYGFFLLFLCCLLSGYGFLASIGAAFWRHRRLYRSAKMALTTTAVLAFVASLLLWYGLFTHNFSIYYIFKNSSLDLPELYKFTAFWSSLEGSHMLWTLFLTICGTIAIWTHAKDNEHIMPYVSGAIQIVLCWMFYLTITHSDVFAQQLPAAPNGRGMNTLLQNPYMAIHPPLLFVGYTALAVPFAYAIAALCYGDITEGWLKTVRRWSLVAWTFLTVAIILGGRWAYVELGWAGYWAWDPVENSSFMPWLLVTALLHCLLIQGAIGHLKRLSIVLAIMAFFMSFFGTFITRSGVITSVHSFAESSIGPNYLAFIAAMLFLSALLYGFRAHSILPPDVGKVWGVSKESALVVTLLLVLSFWAIVFIGTIFPIVSEAVTSQRISVQAPYFNAFSPFVGLAMMIAIAVGNLMHYQSPRLERGKKIMLLSLGVALPFAALFIYMGNVLQTRSMYGLVAQIIGVYVAGWAASCLTIDVWYRMRKVNFNYGLFFKRSRAFFGAYVAHIGMLLMVLGFLGNYRGMEAQVSLPLGEKKELFGYTFEMKQKIQTTKRDNAILYSAPIWVSRNGKSVGEMHPARSKYPTSDDLLHEVAVLGGLWRDIYIILADFNKQSFSAAVVKININPTVRFVLDCHGNYGHRWDHSVDGSLSRG